MEIATGTEVGSKIIEALGLPKLCTVINIHLQVEKPVLVTATYYPTKQAMAEVAAVLEQYNLVAKK